MSSTSLTPLSLEISLTMIDPFFRLWLCRFLVWYRLNPITGSSFLVDSVGISNGENVWFVSPTSSMFSSGLIHAISTKVRFLFYFCLCELNPFVDYFPKFCLLWELPLSIRKDRWGSGGLKSWGTDYDDEESIFRQLWIRYWWSNPTKVIPLRCFIWWFKIL